MSYILDALRKSEAERSPNATPNLLAVQHMRGRPRTAVLWSLVVVLVVNSALIGFWLLRPTTPRGSETLAAPSIRPTSPPPVRAEPDVQALPTQPIGEASREDDAAPQPSVAAPIETAASSVDSIEVSSHVYSADPQARAITIAGRRYQQGDEIAPGLRLIEITEGGIVVDDHGERRVVDVLNGWR